MNKYSHISLWLNCVELLLPDIRWYWRKLNNFSRKAMQGFRTTWHSCDAGELFKVWIIWSMIFIKSLIPFFLWISLYHYFHFLWTMCGLWTVGIKFCYCCCGLWADWCIAIFSDWELWSTTKYQLVMCSMPCHAFRFCWLIPFVNISE